MSVIVDELLCPSCGHHIGSLQRPFKANRRAAGGPHSELVQAWLHEDAWSGTLTATDVKARFDQWAARSGHTAVEVSPKALAMGMQLAGVRSGRDRRSRYWIR